MLFKKARELPDVYWIEDAEQLALLDSPVRQEILDTLEASDGPLSVPEMARRLGRPADGLYYHVERLLDGGLLREAGTRRTRGRSAAVYGLPGRTLAVRYPLADPEGMASIRRMVSAMTRVAQRDFESGTEVPWAEAEGEERNLWAARVKGWLSPEEVEEVNRLLGELVRVFADASRSEGSRLAVLTWVLSPVEDRPVRRGEEDGADEEAMEAGSRWTPPSASPPTTGSASSD